MKITRLFTKEGRNIYGALNFKTVYTETEEPVRVPEYWGQVANDIFVEEMLFRGERPTRLEKESEKDVPEWLWGKVVKSADRTWFEENDICQVLDRVAATCTYGCWKAGFFTEEKEARAFFDEWRYVMLKQMAMPELSIMKKAGLDRDYGVEGIKEQDLIHKIPKNNKKESVLEQMEVLAVKQNQEETSVCLDIENPDANKFISWKKDKEEKELAEWVGRKALEVSSKMVSQAYISGDEIEKPLFESQKAGIPDSLLSMVLQKCEQGEASDINFIKQGESSFEDFCFADIERGYQKIKPNLLVSDTFMESAITGHSFVCEDNGQIENKDASALWHNILSSAWRVSEPALVFVKDKEETAINKGYIGKEETSAPYITLNLKAFLDEDKEFKSGAFRHSVHLAVLAANGLQSLIKTTSKTQDYRAIGLGYTGLPRFIMAQGLPYSSERGKSWAGLITALMTGQSLQTSAQLAEETKITPGDLGPVLGSVKKGLSVVKGEVPKETSFNFRPVDISKANKTIYNKVRKLWENSYKTGKKTGFYNSSVSFLDYNWSLNTLLGVESENFNPGLPLLQLTEGVQGDNGEDEIISLFKKQIHPDIYDLLRQLDYDAGQIDDIIFHILGHGTLLGAPSINHETLKDRNFSVSMIEEVEKSIKTTHDIRYAFNHWTLGIEYCKDHLGLSEEEIESGYSDILSKLGFVERDVQDANYYCCGYMSVMSAPHLSEEDKAIFAVIMKEGSGLGNVSLFSRIKMMAAIQPFLTGGFGEVLRISYDSTPEDMEQSYITAWESGLQNVSLFREGSSLLNSTKKISLNNVYMDEPANDRSQILEQEEGVTQEDRQSDLF